MRRAMRNLPSSVAALGLMLWPAMSGADFFTLKGHGGPIMGIAVEPGSGRIATASFDNSVGLWNGPTPVWLEDHRAAVNRVTFLDDRHLVSAGDDFRVLLWDLDKGAARELIAHKGKVMGLAVSPDKKTIASASWDGSIGLSDLDTGKTHVLLGHDSNVNAVVFSKDGQWLYSASADGTIRIWDVAQRVEKRRLLNHGFGINTLVINEDLGWLSYGAVDGTTRVLSLETDERIADFTLNRRPILAMSYSPVTGRLAVGDGEGYIMVIDTDRWRIARDFRATLSGPVWALALSPDGAQIHAGGLDETLYSWPMDALTEFGTMSDADKPYLRDPAEMTNGERQFARKCSICHSLTADGGRKAGPTLYGLFGRASGKVPSYKYSNTLETADIIWTDATIDALFDLGPDHYIPGSKMPMQRITRSEDRADLIAFLREATAEGRETE